VTCTQFRSVSYIEPEKRNFLVNPEWIDDPDLQNGEVDFLPGVELTFWRDMIDKYLLPLDKDEKKEVWLKTTPSRIFIRLPL